MTSEPRVAEPELIAISDADVDEAIAACGGDMREAVRALLIAGHYGSGSGSGTTRGFLGLCARPSLALVPRLVTGRHADGRKIHRDLAGAAQMRGDLRVRLISITPAPISLREWMSAVFLTSC
ncbi:hypothetical protein GCM10028812_53410 [Ancylobacter sonchi]